VAIAAFAGVASAGADCVPDLVSASVPSGKSQTILSKSGGEGAIVDLSPDRTSVLINQGLHLVAATTSGHVIATLADGLGTIATVRWSPDGKLVAFIVHAARATCGSSVQLWVVQASGDGLRKLSDCANYPAWAPDSKHLAFMGSFREGLGGTLSVIGADGGNRKDLLDWKTTLVPTLAWGRGNRIAYGAGVAVKIVRGDGTGRTVTIANADSPAWRPDGRRLAVVLGRRVHQPVTLETVDENGSHVVLIDRSVSISLPTWSRDGRIAYLKASTVRGRVAKGIYVAKPGSQPRRLTREPSDAVAFGLYWTPANDRILYLRCRT
jgi:Tol biopolymer transport system component